MRVTLLAVVSFLCAVTVCSGAVNTTFISIECPTDQQFDVQYGPVRFNCLLNLTTSIDMNYYSVSAYLSLPGRAFTIQPNPQSVYFPPRNVLKNITFELQRYSVNGTYRVLASSYGGTASIEAESNFTVKATVNDRAPPKLLGLSIPPVNISAISKAALRVIASDDLTPIVSIDATLKKTDSNYGLVRWQTPNTTNPSTNLDVQAPFSYWYQAVPGIYEISVSLCDKIGWCASFTTQELKAAGFQELANVGPVAYVPDFFQVSCDEGLIDVGLSAVNVTCNYTVSRYKGIKLLTLYVFYNGGIIFYAVPSEVYYNNNNASITYRSGTVTYQFPRYAPVGNYTVKGECSDLGSLTLYAVEILTVKESINDNQPPKLTKLFIQNPLYDLLNLNAIFSATDDITGVQSISLSFQGTGATGAGSWYTETVTSAHRNITNFVIPLNYAVRGKLAGVYTLTAAILEDAVGNQVIYTTDKLRSLGLQYNFTVVTKKYYVKSAQTGLVATAGALSSNVVMDTKNATDLNQLWSYVVAEGGFVENIGTGHVMDIQSGSTSPNANIITWTRKTSGYNVNQQWLYNTTTQVFTSKAVNLVLDVRNGNTQPGGQLIIYHPKPPPSNNNQRFILEEYVG